MIDTDSTKETYAHKLKHAIATSSVRVMSRIRMIAIPHFLTPRNNHEIENNQIDQASSRDVSAGRSFARHECDTITSCRSKWGFVYTHLAIGVSECITICEHSMVSNGIF